MARGFESKDVEFQQAEAERLSRPRHAMTADDRARADRRRTLHLSLTRMRKELEGAKVAAHRHMIEQAIAALEEQMAALGPA